MSATVRSDTEIRPFRVRVSDSELADLRARLAATRWPEGVALASLRELVEYWHTGYDWRENEAWLNLLPQFATEIDGADVHFVHMRSPDPDALPLVLTPCWPSTFTEYLHMIGPLTNPRAYGGDPADAFHLVIPSIPGHGLSRATSGARWTARRVAAAWDELLGRLGYDRYGAHGGGLSSAVCRELRALAPEALVGVHVREICAVPPGDGDSRRRAAPPSGPADSPAALLASLLEPSWAFGEPVEVLDRDLLLTNVTLYWVTRTDGSAARLSGEDAREDDGAGRASGVPAGVAVLPGELDRGGRFPAPEAPDLLTGALRAFFRGLR